VRLRLVGDIHNVIRAVVENYRSTDYDVLIQLGDFGSRETYEKHLKNFDPNRLKILPGNHDDYDAIPDFKEYFLGDFGLLDGTDGKVFYVRGAYSIDKMHRTKGFDWWQEEELNWAQSNACLDLWERVGRGVEVVLSHDAPQVASHSILGTMPNNTQTGRLLTEMLNMHEPQAWYFGHYHKSWEKRMGKTLFRCLDINEATTIEA
jgi:hypothetical protein